MLPGGSVEKSFSLYNDDLANGANRSGTSKRKTDNENKKKPMMKSSGVERGQTDQFLNRSQWRMEMAVLVTKQIAG